MRLSPSRRTVFKIATVGLSLLIGLILAETTAALIEPNMKASGAVIPKRDPELGWLPPIGRATIKTGEFTAQYDVNAQGMNDRPIEESVGRSAVRLLALGDSHTFAVGVSQQEAWPNALEQMLYGGDAGAGTVYNAGVAGYSLGQYLVRYRQLADKVTPQIVLIGFSMATDLYDLVPPRLGGFVYGSDSGRVYFDLADDGTLVESRDLVGKRIGFTKRQATGSQRLRGLLDRLALFRAAKKSRFAMAIAARGWRPGGESLWPGPDTALRKTLDATSTYRWALAEALIAQIAKEAQARGSRVLLVNIPYLPEVYDDVWNTSFGARPEEFDRGIGGRRLAAVCQRVGIGFVDTTRPLTEEVRRRSEWLHFRYDGHPTADGHQVIARAVLRGLTDQALLPLPATSAPAHPAQ